MSSMSQERAGPVALVISVLAHGVLVAFTGALAPRALAAGGPSPRHGLDGAPAGNTFDIEGLDEGPGSAPAKDDTPRAVTPRPVEPAPEQPATTTLEPPPSATAKTEPPTKPAKAEPEPAPPPRPPRKRRPPPATSAAAGASAAPATSASAAPQASAGAGTGAGDGGAPGAGKRYGAEEGKAGDRMVGRAFTRAVPNAVSADKRWAELPVGDVGSIELTIQVGPDGKMVRAEYDEKAPAALRSVVERTLATMRAGTFALTAAPGAPGSETLRITVTLSDVEPAILQHWDPPGVDKPGRCWFIQPTGRRFDAVIRIVSSRAIP
jgi:hypothetical protein